MSTGTDTGQKIEKPPSLTLDYLPMGIDDV